MKNFKSELMRVNQEKNFYTESIKKRETVKEFQEVEKLLIMGEQVKPFLLDLYGDRSTFIFCTDLRIIYLEKKDECRNEKHIFFEKIKYIESDFNLNKGKIKITWEEDFLLIENISEKTIRYIFDLYKYYREESQGYTLKEKEILREEIIKVKEKEISLKKEMYNGSNKFRN